MTDSSSLLKTIGFAAAIAIVILAFRLISTGNYPVELFGYDFGFYSYTVQHTPLDSPSYFLGQLHDYGNHLFVILNWVRLPQLPSLIFLYYFFQACSGALLWLILRRHSKLAGWIGLLLFADSIAQTQMHTMFLWKAAYGQTLLLTAFYFLENKQWRLAIIPSAILLITHKTTSAIYLVTAAIYSLINIRSQKKYSQAILGAILILILVYISHVGWGNLQTTFWSDINPSVSSGIFLDWLTYLKYAWLLLPFAAYGIFIEFKKERSQLWLILLGVSLLWIIAALPFYNRILQYADLALIYFAAYGAVTLPWPKNKKIIAIILLCAISVIQFCLFKNTLAPQITPIQAQEIRQFAKTHQGAFVVAVNAQDAPWLLAYLHGNVRLAAPGLFEDRHSYEEWESFWQNPETEFLNSFPAPLYIYQTPQATYPQLDKCLEQVSPNFFKYSCN